MQWALGGGKSHLLLWMLPPQSQIMTVIYWELCNVPNAFKTSFILSSPFSPPLTGSGHRWQQTASWVMKAMHMSYIMPPQAHLKMLSTGVPPPLQKCLDILQKFLENPLQAPGPPPPCSRRRKQFTGADESQVSASLLVSSLVVGYSSIWTIYTLETSENIHQGFYLIPGELALIPLTSTPLLQCDEIQSLTIPRQCSHRYTNITCCYEN